MKNEKNTKNSFSLTSLHILLYLDDYLPDVWTLGLYFPYFEELWLDDEKLFIIHISFPRSNFNRVLGLKLGVAFEVINKNNSIERSPNPWQVFYCTWKIGASCHMIPVKHVINKLVKWFNNLVRIFLDSRSKNDYFKVFTQLNNELLGPRAIESLKLFKRPKFRKQQSLIQVNA